MNDIKDYIEDANEAKGFISPLAKMPEENKSVLLLIKKIRISINKEEKPKIEYNFQVGRYNKKIGWIVGHYFGADLGVEILFWKDLPKVNVR